MERKGSVVDAVATVAVVARVFNLSSVSVGSLMFCSGSCDVQLFHSCVGGSG